MNVPETVRGYMDRYVTAPRYEGAEKMTLVTADGVALNAVRLAGPADAAATVIVVHGFANWHRTPKVHAFVTRLARDVDVIALDLRGHGYSDGISTIGVLEHLDVAPAVAAADPSRPVIVVGTSLGSAAAVGYAGGAARGDGNRCVDAVIAVSGPAWFGREDADGVVRIRQLAGSAFIRRAMKVLMRTRVGGCDAERVDPVSFVADFAATRLVIVHDRGDWYFSPEHAEAMAAAAQPRAEIWWSDEALHGTDLLSDELAQRILDEVVAPIVAGRG